MNWLESPVSKAAVAVVCLAFVLPTSHSNSQMMEMPPRVKYIDTGDSLPRIEFANGLVSINDRCPVRNVKLNLRLPPLYVNGRPVGFC